MNLKKLFLAILASLSFFVIANQPLAYAEESEQPESESQQKQEETETQPSSNLSLEITPVSKRIGLDPGQTKDYTITVKNHGADSTSFSVYATAYSNGDDGESQDFETQTSYTQISRWITIQASDGSFVERSSFKIGAGETKTVTFRVTVPEDAAGGGQYATLFVQSDPSAHKENSIETISRAGIVIYATISGETKRAAQLGDITSSSVSIGKNIDIKSTVKNIGNIDFQASTEITVSSVFGKELYRNTVIASILPENSKTVYTEWNDTPSFGIYRLNYTISALDINASGSQWVLVLSPLSLALAIVLVILTIIAIVYLVKRHSAKNDADIIIG